MVSVPASPVKVTNVVAWSGSVSNHGDTNLNDDDPPPACCHDPAWATPLTVRAVGLSPVQIQTVVPAGSVVAVFLDRPAVAGPALGSAKRDAGPGPDNRKGQHRSHGQPAELSDAEESTSTSSGVACTSKESPNYGF